jgi:hypothetical protein
MSLNLGGNEIDDYAMKYLAEALTGPSFVESIKALHLGRTEISQQVHYPLPVFCKTHYKLNCDRLTNVIAKCNT